MNTQTQEKERKKVATTIGPRTSKCKGLQVLKLAQWEGGEVQAKDES
jgi:hypothetical protein